MRHGRLALALVLITALPAAALAGEGPGNGYSEGKTSQGSRMGFNLNSIKRTVNSASFEWTCTKDGEKSFYSLYKNVYPKALAQMSSTGHFATKFKVKFQNKASTERSVGTASVTLSGTLRFHSNGWATGKGKVKITSAKCSTGTISWQATRKSG